MPSHRPINAALVRKAQEGDAAAFEEIVRQIKPMLTAWFALRVGRRTEVEDLVQNTLLRLYRSLPDLRNPNRLQAFTMKAAVFEVQDYYRGRYGFEEHLASPDMFSGWSEAAPETGARIDVERMLGLLGEKARTILEMRAYGYNYTEISRLLNMTESAVKMQVKRALDKLREVLGESSRDPT